VKTFRLEGSLLGAAVLILLVGCAETHHVTASRESAEVTRHEPQPRHSVPSQPLTAAMPATREEQKRPATCPVAISPSPTPTPIPTSAPVINAFAASQPATRAAVVPTQVAPKAVKVRVAAYNTQSGRTPRKILENLRSVTPDLVFLQEVSQSNVRFYAENLGLNYQFGPYQPNVMFGLGILAPGQITPVKLFTMPGERNFAMAARIVLGGQEILVVTVHLKSLPRPLVSGMLKVMGPHKAQAEEILELVKKENLPTIVAGDFNTLSFTPEYLTLSSTLKDSSSILGTTSQPSIIINGAGYRIDYIFFRGPWKPLKYQTRPLPGSDHRMIWSELDLTIK